LHTDVTVVDQGVVLGMEIRKLFIDLSVPRKILIVGVGERAEPKEYFLKVTERGGLVLV